MNAFRLKLVGAVCMALSVASTTVVPALLGAPSADNMGSLTAAVLCEAVSWTAIPIYAWLLVEGSRVTCHAGAYLGRLVALAAVCEVPYDLVASGMAFDPRSQNPVWGLAIALAVLMLLDWAARRYAGASGRAARWALSALIVVAGLLWNLLLGVGVRQRVMFVGVATLLFALVFRFLRARENTMMLTAGLLGAVLCVTPAVGVAVLHYRDDRVGGDAGAGRRPWRTRWAWYAVYPALLLAGAALTALTPLG
ncbi:TraX family protein [Bifidobacterium avesanii]|uniref:ABC transporter permease n=1 Tax=Bifidobacterium avesanii TaxID=1798157 RepID=A0A7K3TIX5_9BIFI|nr:TraX family protein [Bifidobacterium avesanii]KAB8291956.1 ABC transporter permease [Bifidobacterium avesanii]NEG79057.1 ABC transporter permease [Bifidobacterium avesanii]